MMAAEPVMHTERPWKTTVPTRQACDADKRPDEPGILSTPFSGKKPGWVCSRYQIVEGVRGGNYPVTDRSVDVVIVGSRKKLGEAGNCIETVRGAGYRFKEA
jgi:hypothetical protein